MTAITCRHYREGSLRRRRSIRRPSATSSKSPTPGVARPGRPSEESIALIQREFDLHELAMEDSASGASARRSRCTTVLFLVAYGLSLGADDEIVDAELHAFAGHRFLVTSGSIRVRHHPVLKRWDRSPSSPTRAAGSSCTRCSTRWWTAILTSSDVLEESARRSRMRCSPTNGPRRPGAHLQAEAPGGAVPALVPPLREVIDLMQEQRGASWAPRWDPTTATSRTT